MPQPLRLLVLEDNPADVELIEHALRRDGFEPTIVHVEREADFVAALEQPFEVILSDFELPQFNGMQALACVRQRGIAIPFIIVSGTIGEETAVTAMRNGAADYLLKDRLGRLGPAIRHVLAESRACREREQAQEALRASEEMFREVVESIHEVFWISDVAKPRMLYVSPSFEKIWGRPCESVLTTPESWLATVYPEDREQVRAALKTQAEGKYDETFRILRPDGTVRWIRDRAYAVRDETGAAVRIVGVAEDITERKQLESQFLRAQRLEAVGTLAGGMAHDLNNILSPVLMAAGLLKDGAASERERDMLTLIERSAQRGAGIIRQLLTFSRGIEGERQAIQIKHLVREMSHIIRETFPREIDLHEELPTELWSVFADSTQIHQVMVNLCVNARDAMPQGGILTLGAHNIELGGEEAAAKPGAKPGRYVVLSIADTGSGMPVEVLDHIFEPFFSTKGIGKGTGLGLSTVQGIVRSHGGLIQVTSEPGMGSTFDVYFPAVPTTDPAEASAEAPPPADGGGQTILLVDDEAAVRDAIQFVLERTNYRVITAANGKEGLSAFIRNRDLVRLVITDAMMPEMGGAALVRAIRVLSGNTKFIALSGLDADHADLQAVGVATVIAKPCGQHVLLEAVQRELAAP